MPAHRKVTGIRTTDAELRRDTLRCCTHAWAFCGNNAPKLIGIEVSLGMLNSLEKR